VKRIVVMVAAAAALGVYGSVQAAGDAAAGKAKSAACAACHGADGNSAAPNFPKLAGQHEGYLLKQLEDFKSGARKNAIMSGQVAALSDQDMQDLAAYFSSQTIKGGTADEKLVPMGEKLYRGGDVANGTAACIGCHGPTGAGNPAAKFPHLAGQHAEYLDVQLKAFRGGERANDAGKMMRNVAAKLSDAEIKAVASYIQGLH
jgi:cytochrome c553